MTVVVEEAGTQLVAWIERALAGETVVISRAGHPLVELKPLIAKPGRKLGAARGLTRGEPGWDAAMTEEEADEFMGVGPA